MQLLEMITALSMSLISREIGRPWRRNTAACRGWCGRPTVARSGSRRQWPRSPDPRVVSICADVNGRRFPHLLVRAYTTFPKIKTFCSPLTSFATSNCWMIFPSEKPGPPRISTPNHIGPFARWSNAVDEYLQHRPDLRLQPVHPTYRRFVARPHWPRSGTQPVFHNKWAAAAEPVHLQQLRIIPTGVGEARKLTCTARIEL